MIPEGDLEGHGASRKHQWREKEVRQGLSWGSLAKECFRYDWKEFTQPDTWWLYEFAVATPGAQQDRDRTLGTHAWRMGLPLAAGQIQLIHPQWVVGPSQVAAFWPDWMAGGEVIAGEAEMTEAFTILNRWKQNFYLRLNPNFLLIPGHKLYALEDMLCSDSWTKARLCIATRVIGARRLMKDGQYGPSIIYEIKSKRGHTFIIGKLDGSWKEMVAPEEAEKTDFWLGSWILQIANILWEQTPRQAALLVCHGQVAPPWTRFGSMQDFTSGT